MHTQDINPSEDTREKLMALIEDALKVNESKVMEIETVMRKSKQKLSPEDIKEYEVEEAHLRHHAKLMADAHAKTERTSGHTLKKAYNRKCMDALRAVMPATQYADLELLLKQSGITLHHDRHHYGHHHHQPERDTTPILEAH